VGGAADDGAIGLAPGLPNQHTTAATASTTAMPRRSPAPNPVRGAPRTASRVAEVFGQAVTANDALTRDDSGRVQDDLLTAQIPESTLSVCPHFTAQGNNQKNRHGAVRWFGTPVSFRRSEGDFITPIKHSRLCERETSANLYIPTIGGPPITTSGFQ